MRRSSTAAAAATPARCKVGDGAVQISEVPLPAAVPEQLTIRIDDTDAAVDRLRVAGFEVTEHRDLSLVASVNVAGVCICSGGSA
jgi:hypothetical protein